MDGLMTPFFDVPISPTHKENLELGKSCFQCPNETSKLVRSTVKQDPFSA